MELSVFVIIGMALVIVGVILIVVALVRASMGGKSGDSRVRGAGVIMIGPIPIVFGTDKNSVKAVLVLALALSVVVLVTFVVYYWMLR